MSAVIKTTFKLRRGKKEAWERNNPVLAYGEPGFEVDTNRLKIGDGVTAWLQLKAIGEEEVFNAKTHLEFPNIGRENTIYKAEEEKKIYQWNTSTLSYQLLSEEEDTDLEINVINGGNAYGTRG